MEDKQVWTLEERLWTGNADAFATLVDEAGIMLVPTAPFLLEGRDAVTAIADAPRWQEVDFAHGKIARPEEGLIVVAYKAVAKREGEDLFNAWCSSTWRRRAHDDWKLVQHQQMHVAEGPLRGG